MRGIGARSLSTSLVSDWMSSKNIPVSGRPGAAGYQAAVLADSPNLYLAFDGATPTDSSGWGFAVGAQGSAWTTGEPGLIPGGFSWKATGVQYVSYTQTELTTSASVTVEGWFKATSFDTYAPIWDSDNSLARRFQLTITGGVARFIWWTTSTGPHTITGATGISANTPYHIAATYDSVTGTAKIYVNGNQDATGSSGAIALKSGGRLEAAMARGGTGTVGTGGYFYGWIDEYAYYPTALSSTRIMAHYNAGAA